jgi:ATP-dependent Lhr-like helicase
MPQETVNLLWDLVWKGVITNDTFYALRAFTRGSARIDRRERRVTHGRPTPKAFRSRRIAPLTAEGRWSLLETRTQPRPTPTEWSAAVAQQLLNRYGVVTREVAGAESIPGGFSAVYDVFKALEDSGRIRRGYFVGGVGAMQFAMPGALDLLRSLRDEPEEPEVVTLAATDPANPYGALLKWPGAPDSEDGGGKTPMRSVGAQVVLVNGALAAYVSKGGRQLIAYLPENEPDRSRVARAIAAALAAVGLKRREGMLIAEINGRPAHEHPLSMIMTDVGFTPSAMGLHLRRGEPAMPKLKRPWGPGQNA